jgi:hypothetical protein
MAQLAMARKKNDLQSEQRRSQVAKSAECLHLLGNPPRNRLHTIGALAMLTNP